MRDIVATERCLNCNKILDQMEGKKTKVFCNSTCRSNYWQRSSGLEKQGKTAEEIVSYLSKNFASKRPDKKEIKLPNFHKVVAETPQDVVDRVKEVMNGQDQEDILKQIAAIKAEKIPTHRDTSLGRKVWELEKKQRISDLEKQLK